MSAASTTAASTAGAKQPVPASAPQIQEFSIRVPKNTNKKHNVMRFNAVFKVDFKEWKHVKMERENNLRDFKPLEEEMPKFGAGSEFGREAKEEARKKKYGMASRRYKAEDQPWILQANGKSGKKFRGLREGGVSEHAAYYVFTHAPDGAIEAFPLHEWYNFQPIARYKALSAEEAEEQFNRRNKVINYFSLMMRKRLRNDEEGGEEESLEGEKGKKPSKKEKELKISEMDEWMDSDDEDNSDSDKEDKKKSDDEDNKKNKKKGVVKKKKKKQPSDDEAFEESDDGDEEGRECDYISDSSASDSELEQQKEIKSVAEEDALRKLLASDEEDEDENQEKKENEDENEENKEKEDKDKAAKLSDKKKDKKKMKGKRDASDSSSDMESGAESKDVKDSDNKPASAQSSRSTTPTSSVVASAPTETLKRMLDSSADVSQAKKLKYESYGMNSSYVAGSSESGITEDAVRRYLMRKPMTTKELLLKFKSKKTGLTSDQIVNIMTKILKNLAPASQKIKGKMYFSIKAQPHHQPSEPH